MAIDPNVQRMADRIQAGRAARMASAPARMARASAAPPAEATPAAPAATVQAAPPDGAAVLAEVKLLLTKALALLGGQGPATPGA
jgi:hypothetical protein